MYKVCVLMSTYNGEKYIKRQLETLFNQKDVDIHILIRDDGSIDETINIIKSQKSEKVSLIEGTNIGFAQSFWFLLKIENDFDFYAFCDQDDIWHEDKLISAIELLKDINGPTLYTSDVITVDETEHILNPKGFGVTRTLNYQESLIKSVVPGCTFVFNKLLKEQLCKYEGFMISHDWTTYIIANAIGKVIFDSNSHIYYRIHGSNTIGIDNSLLGLRKKIKRLIKPTQTNTRSKVASNVYHYFSGLMDTKKRDITLGFSNCSKSSLSAMKLLKIKEYRKIDFMMMLLMRRV